VPFDQEAELDTRLSGIALTAIHAKYESQFAGRDLMAAMKEAAQNPDDGKIATRVDKAIKAALADIDTLVAAVSSEGSDEVPADAGNDVLLLEIFHRLQDNWKADTAPAVKMLDLEGANPSWTDVAALFSELSAVDHDGGDGESFPSEWYDDLLTRYENRLGKDKPKKKTSKRTAAPVIKEPPPDAEIVDYSPKSTFGVDQWVRHPKFGVGIVIESAQHVTLEFAGERKILAHVAQVAAPVVSKKSRPIKPSGDTIELARAAGIDIKKVPARFDEET
jgi:hypothetical protein